MSEPEKKRRFRMFSRKKKAQQSDQILPQPTDDPSQWLDTLPDTDAQALEQLSQVSQDEVRPLIITPQEERYPPLNPAAPVPGEQESPPAKQTKTAKPKNNRRKNIITGLALIGTLFLCVWYSIIWVDPQTALNPLPPFTPFMEVTATPNGGIVVPQTDGTDTAPNRPTAEAPTVDFPFVPAPTGVIYVPNENGQGCEWQSIAGSINGLDGAPLSGFSVRIRGGNGFDERVFSGVTQTFGEGGYELFISGVPQAADYTVQLLTAQGAPLSDEIAVSTRADCDGNVAIVNFVQVSGF